jgi:hypothetical protein
MNTEKKMYVLVRKDIPPIHRAVQGSHAVAEFLIHHNRDGWKNGTMIMLGVPNEKALKYWKAKLADKAVAFYEPDIGNQMTALATIDEGSIFRRLNLLDMA